MTYSHIVPGRFLRRPNRFIAHCEVQGQERVCHVKNTGRCRELLTPGCRVYLEYLPSPGRKTDYDLIGVEKNGVLFNIDSTAPNKAVAEWLPTFLPEGASIQPEYTFGSSRLDFYAAYGDTRLLMEVKGVTLEQDGVVLFPDAPTKRGVKHLQELTRAVAMGYRCCVLFVVQTRGVAYFTPNRQTDPHFAHALEEARDAGVEILCYDCTVTQESMTIRHPVPIRW